MTSSPTSPDIRSRAGGVAVRAGGVVRSISVALFGDLVLRVCTSNRLSPGDGRLCDCNSCGGGGTVTGLVDLGVLYDGRSLMNGVYRKFVVVSWTENKRSRTVSGISTELFESRLLSWSNARLMNWCNSQ